MKSQDQNPTIDDKTLIEYFVKGESKAFYSKTLQIEHSFNLVQLKTLNNELIALFKPSHKIKSALIKYESSYGELLHKTLLKNNFVPFGKSKQQGLFEYHQYDVPSGYKINYTAARDLWKAWWPSQHHSSTLNWASKLDLLIFKDNQWYPLQDITVQEGIVYIKSLVGEITLTTTDKIVWLSKMESENTPKAISAKKSELEIKQNSKLESKSELKPNSEPKINESREEELIELENQAIKTLKKYLFNGETEIHTEVIRNPKGEITSHKTLTIKRECPQWVIEYLISKRISDDTTDSLSFPTRP
ncbi:MAG: hypothetical protein KME08_07455 [Aphanothece sp. CMT-3BRIN-NPC111]|jgi:hypothetical protein|nr:hypothetical protein [Aphanothece sp. CMT-3BRIN-NPC111]